jgi:hypothetical protein
MNHVDDELKLKQAFFRLRMQLKTQFGRLPDLNGILFLVGVNELGFGKRNFSKEEKQDILHVAVCTLLSRSGYYTLTHYDAEGWPHFEPSSRLPKLSLLEQELLLKQHILNYFKPIFNSAP